MTKYVERRGLSRVINNTRKLAEMVGQDPVELARRLDAARKAARELTPQTPPPASDDR